MARGTVQVENMNLMQGEPAEIERKFLFIGIGGNAANIGKTLSLTNDTDLDVLLGEGDSPLKTHLTAAALNAGPNWFGWCLPVSATATNTDCLDAFDTSMTTYFKKAQSPEAVVVLRHAVSESEVSAWHDKMMEWRGKTGRQMFALVNLPKPLLTQTWADYEAMILSLVANVAANRVCVVPDLHGNDAGVLSGRLCNRSVGVGDTPMRTKTGPVLGLGATPLDADDVELPESMLTVFSSNRLSTIQHYAYLEGTYWADASMLEVQGGDFRVVEYLRPVLKACRAVQTIAEGLIGDKNFNDTPESIALHKSIFERPLRAMSKSTDFEVGGVKRSIVGDIMPPSKAVAITWLSKSKVNVVLTVKPYSCPKDITAFVVLDLSLEG